MGGAGHLPGPSEGLRLGQVLAGLDHPLPHRLITRKAAHRSQRGDVPTAGDRGQRPDDSGRPRHHVTVGARKQVCDRLQLVPVLLQARHAEIQHLGRLVAAYVGGLAGVRVHPDPFHGVLVQRMADPLENFGGVRLSRSEERLAYASRPSRVPGPRDLFARATAEWRPREHLDSAAQARYHGQRRYGPEHSRVPSHASANPGHHPRRKAEGASRLRRRQASGHGESGSGPPRPVAIQAGGDEPGQLALGAGGLVRGARGTPGRPVRLPVWTGSIQQLVHDEAEAGTRPSAGPLLPRATSGGR